jgi:hypothetical protein
MVRLLTFNDLSYFINTLFGDMGGPHKEDFLSIVECESVEGITHFFISHAVNYTEGRAEKQGNLTGMCD